MTVFIVTPYSRFKTKKAIKDAIKTEDGFAKNPTIDLYKPPEMVATSPNEIKEYLKKTSFPVTNPKRSWFGTFTYSEKTGKWKFT